MAINKMSIQIPLSARPGIITPGKEHEQSTMLLIITIESSDWDHNLVKEVGMYVASKLNSMTPVENFGQQCERVMELVREKTDAPVLVAYNTPIVPGQMSISYSLEDSSRDMEEGKHEDRA